MLNRTRLKNEKAPAAVGRSGGGSKDDEVACTDESTARKPKRKLGSVWLDRGHYLYRTAPNGSNVFDTLKCTGKPLPRRGT